MASLDRHPRELVNSESTAETMGENGHMRCASCGTENRAERRFCAQCGAALEATCPSCGASNDPDDRFCGSCGARLGGDSREAHVTATPSAVSERRLVS